MKHTFYIPVFSLENLENPQRQEENLNHPSLTDFHTILGKVFSILATENVFSEMEGHGGLKHGREDLGSLCDPCNFTSWLAGTEQTKCSDCCM